MDQLYAKIVKPVRMNSRELIGSTERIISPLEAKAIHGSIDSTETVLEYEAKHKLGGAIFPSYGSYDSAPAIYGAVFSSGMRCDPDSWIPEEKSKKPWWQFWNASEMYAGKGQSNHISQSEYQI